MVIHTYRQISYGRRHQAFSDDDLACFLRTVATKENGIFVAVDILHMKFHRDSEEDAEWSPAVVDFAGELLSIYPFTQQQRLRNTQDHELANIARVCLQGEEAGPLAIVLCNNLLGAFINYSTYPSAHGNLLNVIAQLQPIIFLNVFWGSEDRSHADIATRTLHDSGRHSNPLTQIDDDMLIAWCEENPGQRYPLITSAIDTYSVSKTDDNLEWKPIIYTIIEKAPDLDAALERLTVLNNPTSWTDSRADLLQRRAVLYESLFTHANPNVRTWARAQHISLQDSIQKDREWEASRNRRMNERFE